MEILKIKSSHGLSTSIIAQRPEGSYTYQLNCRQFETAYRAWQRNATAQDHALGVMTLDYERIFVTKDELERISGAIQATRSPLALD